MLVELSVAAVAVATDQFWILVVAGPVIAASWYLAEGHRQIALPRWVVNVGACVSLLLIVLNAIAEPDPARSMEWLAAFVVALIVLRQLQLRTTREDAQQILLSAVLIIASTMQTDRLLYGFILLIWIAVALYVVVLFQLYSGTEAARLFREENSPKHSPLVPPLNVRFGPQDIKNIRLTVLISFLGIIVVSALVFIFFPRQLLFRSGVPGRGMVQRSEFVQTVDLVVSERISSSRREVFSLEWVAPGGESMEWIAPVLMRGAVLEEYDAARRRWVAAPTFPGDRKDARIEVPANGFVGLGITPIQKEYQTYIARVTMRSMASDVVFAPWVAVAISSAPGRRFEMDRRTLIITESSFSMVGSYASYELEIQPFPNAKAIRSLVGNAGRAGAPVSFPVPEIRELALGALEEMGESPERTDGESEWQRNRRVAQALEVWLEERCSYTVNLADFIQIPGEDPIVSFISRYRFGHCEYFASALTSMCRSLGVDARLVTGYVAIDYDDVSRSYIVRESNAHAWTEVRVGEYDWESLDPSPSAVLEQLQDESRSWADSWRWVYDRLDFFWNSTIIAFDQRSQQKIQTRLTGGWEETLSSGFGRISEQLQSVNRVFRFGVAGYVWMITIVFLAFAFVWVGISILRRRRRILRELGVGDVDKKNRRKLIADLAFWVDAMHIMAKKGLVKSPSETPLAFAQRASLVDPLAGTTLADFARAMYRIRFGRYEPSQEEVQELNERVRSLR